jgi:hypothetical protein
VQALTGLRPQQPDPNAPQLSEGDQKAIAAVYRLFPQLKPLLEKAQDLLQLPDRVQQFQTNDQSRWQDIGTRMWDSFDKAVKGIYGDRQLAPFAQKAIDQAFISWLETDQNAAARYRMGDLTLAKEFMDMYKTGVIVAAQGPSPVTGPPRRPGQQQQPPRVPRGGGGVQTPPGRQPAQPAGKTADQLHDEAADAYFSARG